MRSYGNSADALTARNSTTAQANQIREHAQLQAFRDP
jgi:hypothetical protein